MAMMDDPEFLVMHIRNSFITSDDTGMCELIMDSEDAERSRQNASNGTASDLNTSDSAADSSDCELSHSYDILPDMDYGAHRRRSNTSVRLEKLKKDKVTQVKVEHVPWKSLSTCNQESVDALFTRKELTVKADSNRTSLLADLIDTYGAVLSNPFMEFSKFDGRANLATQTKKIDIYLTMATPRDRPFPMSISVVSSAKVRDLIGYICWQYTSEGREPALIENPQVYALHIAEDDGEVDTDFPCLNIKEPVAKFGFGKLALVETLQHAPATNYSTDPIVVHVNIPGKGFSKVPVDDLDIQLKDILERVVKKRKMITRPGIEYNLERQDQPGVPLDLETMLGSYDNLEFCLVRRNSRRGDVAENEAPPPADTFSSHRFKTYIVSVAHKLRANTDVQLGISGTKIELDPVTNRSTRRLFRIKPMTLDMDQIQACDIIETKANDRTSFRVTYTANNEHKYLDFEAEHGIASQITQKITGILEWRCSPALMKQTPLPKDRRSWRKRGNVRSAYFT